MTQFKSVESYYILIFLLNINIIVNAGVMHTHTTDIHKERDSDGAYSPRDRGHFSEDGDHHSEFDHEAIIGSHKEAEEYDTLTPEEAKRRLGLLLKKMDLNGDGQIDKRELKAWILRSFQMLSEEEAIEKLEDADEDNNGLISWAEYLSDTYGIDESSESLNFGDDTDHLVADDKELWKAADKNGDGFLDSTEWVSFSHPEEHPDMLPIILKQTLRDKDKDGDGSIDFQEFVGDRAVDHDKEWLQIEKAKFDSDLDKNHDGKLSGSEILSWVVPSNEEIAEEEVQHLFTASDDDLNGILSFDEVIEHHDTFVGSEATDYGDHLHNIHQFDDEL